MNGSTIIAAALFVGGSAFSLEYETDIMPFLSEKCGECHSKETKAKGGLKLDDPKHLSGRFEKNSVIVPGDWDASGLFISLFRPADHKDAMPPKGKGTRLSPEETRKVQQWIADGASIDGKTGEKGPMPKQGEAGYIAVATDAPTPKPRRAVEQDWTNTEGRTIRATLLRVDGDKALLRLKNGQVYPYPIAKLSDQSKALLPKQ